HVLTPDQVLMLTPVDILLVPVGGKYTIGPQEAWEIIEIVEPRVVVPMHYKVGGLTLDLGKKEPFLDLAPGEVEIQRLGNETELDRDMLPRECEVWLFSL